ncbi:hypothetical protein KY290_015323 [Solanum tuberosum]|uniref:Uncharacterized protein n=1 Tax=Solanum tuberosum TaxID=4113 RepID=A0ABQ7VS49_SOLTU|nr:hypothetical protein KY289_014938 [Solanum tuberosum]KAH0771342.1 hypothetical protein KY290_015323 [Solanum tuberosum]
MVNSKDNSSTDSENSSGDVPDSKPSLYFEGEKVLAYHGPRIYEAKAYAHHGFKSYHRQRLDI